MTGANSCGAETRLIDFVVAIVVTGTFAGMKYISLKIPEFRK